jgi:uncharacterized membrane protein
MVTIVSIVMTVLVSFWMEHAVWEDSPWLLMVLAVFLGIFSMTTLLRFTDFSPRNRDKNTKINRFYSIFDSFLFIFGSERHFSPFERTVDADQKQDDNHVQLLIAIGIILIFIFAFHHLTEFQSKRTIGI